MTRPPLCRRRTGRPAVAFTLIELLVVIVILAILISVLLPSLNRARQQALKSKMAEAPPPASVAPRPHAYEPKSSRMADQAAGAYAGPPAPPPPPPALVKSFAAKVDLTPRLSVGTAQPESIYEAKFTATLEAAAAPQGRDGGVAEQSEIRLPLPPQIISLADLSVTVNKQPSDAVTLQDAALVWVGPLPATPTPIEVTYAAVGKGLYELRTPPGRILDKFDLQLTANGSDVRMLELSLQPTSLSRGDGRTVYAWNYQRLMFGRPISVDVLGVAPIDRLGELTWLGPLSVVVFGLIVGLYAHAFALVAFDRWMLLTILGAFTGAYPLMYFAQEFVPLKAAMLGSAALVLVLVAWRAWSIIGLRHALVGVVVPAVGTLGLTLTVATNPHLQGLLLTGAAIAVFVVAMILIPRIQWAAATTNGGGVTPPQEPPMDAPAPA